MLTFSEFLRQMAADSTFAVTAVLTLAVILVNGWTDAPNAIATCIGTGAMGMNAAIGMAAVCNLMGALGMAWLCPAVTDAICGMVEFGADARAASIALCAALFAIVTWAVAAWRFGIPTSESHALIAGITGAAAALTGSFACVNGREWGKVLLGLLLAAVLGMALGAAAELLTRGLFRRASQGFFRHAQRAAAAGTAFLHGAQDGQKFIGVLLLGRAFALGETGGAALRPPLWLLILGAVMMGLGTAMGGRRIIRKMGYELARLSPRQGFATDLAASLCLLLPTALGIPVSTTHTKTAAILGVGAAAPEARVNRCAAREMALAWLCTFPGCGLIGFFMARLFLRLLF